jgi:twinkle protein
VHCFSCGENYKSDGGMNGMESYVKKDGWPNVEAQLAAADPAPITNRGITSATVGKYGVAVAGERHIYPYFNNGDSHPCAAKTRVPVGVGKKVMPWNGDHRGIGLFGQQLFSGGGKYLTIAEGETDAMACFQMLGSKYPAVSVANGADGAVADCKRSFKFIDSFDTIVLAFDQDDAGQKAAKQVATLFAGKCKIMRMDDGADPVDYLRANRGKEWVDTWWRAELVTPDGIIAAADQWELVSAPIQAPDWTYPWRQLNEITYGGRFAELVTVAAGSGLGKSQVCREIVHHILKTTDLKVGGLFLEETPKKTLLSLMSLAVNKLLHLPRILWRDDGTYESVEPSATTEELQHAFAAEFGDGRVFLYDHFGSMSVDAVASQIRYQVKALGCNVILLDHLSIVISGQSNGDERKAIDEMMTRLRMLAQETNCSIIAVSHLTRPAGKGHEEGAATALSQLRGSGAIGQLSDMALGLERNGQAECPLDRNTTLVRVLKNRFSGETGPACHLIYDKETGRMSVRNMDLEEAL